MYLLKLEESENGICMEISKDVFDLVFPKGISLWFDIVKAESDEKSVTITFEEKDIPPLDEEDNNATIVARKFHDITVSDFPLRGRETLLIFRRRYWKVEGRKEYLKRDLNLTFPGTQLETEFALFLKDAG